MDRKPGLFRKGLLLMLCAWGLQTHAQVTGGQFAFEYLRLSNSPHITALGGINVASPENDISLALQNPALMRPDLHNQLALSYNNYYGGTSISNLQYGFYAPKINTAFALGVQYLNYGEMTSTDFTGNETGSFKAADYDIVLGASRSYLNHWRYGASITYAQSRISDKYATVLAANVGVIYHDSESLWTFGATAKNMGVMASAYEKSSGTEPIPFDLQLGVSKRFKHLPLRLMATVHHLYEWDIRYDNPADVQSTNLFNQDTTTNTGSHFSDKLFRHFIFAAELNIAKRILVTVSYNHLHRQELVIQDKTGLAGFAFGGSINLNKFQVRYARSYYSIAGATNEFGLNLELNKLLGLGKTGEHIGWNNTYPSWE